MTDNSYGSMPPQAPVATRPVGGGGMATAALVLGILALITSFTVFGGVLLGLLAIIFGVIGLRRANRGLALGRGRAIAGIILGVLGILVAGLLIAIGVSILNSPEGKDLQSCLRDAGSNQSQVQQCQDEYRSKVGGS
ncbi:MAG: DUF4190 domain-containing protein [Actinobacteria bacterium]|nr:DUF4190 domain-containing protein [Actinomycetota bacterium]